MDIHTLIQKRKSFLEAQKANKFDLSTVLVGLYAEASHFVYEILQNAEDAQASWIRFELFKDRLEITHDGIPFSVEDIDGITGISNLTNEKKSDRQSIGKFGIGFKSVYAVTSSPRVQSGKYDFSIRDFILPVELTDSNSFEQTKFTLTFNHPTLAPKDCESLIAAKFESLESYNLLFLQNLNHIQLIWDDEKKEIRRTAEEVDQFEHITKTHLYAGAVKESYLHFSTPVTNSEFDSVAKKPKISIAFAIDVSKTDLTFIEPETSKLFTYFETGKETFLEFFINAPFTTTPARDNINTALPINKALLEELGDLFKEVLDYFQHQKLVTVNLLERMPIHQVIDSREVIYHYFFDLFKEELLNGRRFLPSRLKNQLHKVQDVALSRSKAVTNLFHAKKDLFDLTERSYWLDQEITIDRTPDLFEYLEDELDIPSFDAAAIARDIDEDFISTRSDQWMQSFYGFLSEGQDSLLRDSKTRYLRGPLRSKPIIRLTNGDHIAPYDDQNRLQFYLPVKGKSSGFNTIKPDVIKSKAAQLFTKNLGVTTPDQLDEIRYHIFSKYQSSTHEVTIKEYAGDLKHVLAFYKSASEQRKDAFVDLLWEKDLRFFLAESNHPVALDFEHLEDLYLPSKELRTYFKHTPDIKFIKVHDIPGVKASEFKALLLDCAIDQNPRVQNFDPYFSLAKLREMRKNYQGHERESSDYWSSTVKDVTLDGLQRFIGQDEINKTESIILWGFLLKVMEEHSLENLSTGSYTWKYYTEHSCTFRSTLLNLLTTSKWLFGRTGIDPYQPHEISVQHLAQDYGIGSKSADRLIKFLGLKQSDFQELLDQLPKDQKKQFQQFNQVQLLCKKTGLDIEEILNRISDEVQDSIQHAEVHELPVLENVIIETDEFENFSSSTVSFKTQESKVNQRLESQKETLKISVKPETEVKDQVGSRGEEIVFTHLKNHYSQDLELIEDSDHKLVFSDGRDITLIELLNDENRLGNGCDITIKKGDAFKAYIEVKSTKLASKDTFQISGYQWALATKKYKQGEGDKYFIYVVKDALSASPKITKIQNPIRKWKKGELKAHLVKIEV